MNSRRFHPWQAAFLVVAGLAVLTAARSGIVPALTLMAPWSLVALPAVRRRFDERGRAALIMAWPALLMAPDVVLGAPGLARAGVCTVGTLLVMAAFLPQQTLPLPKGRLVIAAAVAALVVWCFVGLRPTGNHGDRRLGQDTAYFTQVLHHASRGEAPRGDVVNELLYHPPLRSHFGAHVTPAIYALAVPFRARPGWDTLALCRSLLMLTACLVVARWLTQRGHGDMSVAGALMLFTLPPIWWQPLHTVYLLPMALAPACLLWLGLWEGRRWWWLLGLVGLVLVREDAVLLATAGSALAAVAMRRRVGLSLAVAVFGFAWYIVCVRYIMPQFGEASGEAVSGLFDDVGGPMGLLTSPVEFARRITAPAALAGAGILLRSTGGLALFHPLTLAAVPALAVNALVHRQGFGTLDPSYHYALLPAAAVGIGGIAAIVRRRRNGAVQLPWLGLVPLRAILAVWLAGAMLGALDVIDPGELAGMRPQRESAWLDETIRDMPADWAVAAPRPLLPHLALRSNLYLANRLGDYPDARPDAWLVTDDVAWLGLRDGTEQNYLQLLEHLRSDPQVEHRDHNGRWHLYVRTDRNGAP